jgi:hypothetical protein
VSGVGGAGCNDCGRRGGRVRGGGGEDEDLVEAVGADGADPALGEGVGVRSLNGRPDHLDAVGAEDLVEGVAELAVSIVDEEPEPLLVAELHDQVACLLRGPASGFDEQAMYSIRRVASEMKKST